MFIGECFMSNADLLFGNHYLDTAKGLVAFWPTWKTKDEFMQFKSSLETSLLSRAIAYVHTFAPAQGLNPSIKQENSGLSLYLKENSSFYFGNNPENRSVVANGNLSIPEQIIGFNLWTDVLNFIELGKMHPSIEKKEKGAIKIDYPLPEGFDRIPEHLISHMNEFCPGLEINWHRNTRSVDTTQQMIITSNGEFKLVNKVLTGSNVSNIPQATYFMARLTDPREYVNG